VYFYSGQSLDLNHLLKLFTTAVQACLQQLRLHRHHQHDWWKKYGDRTVLECECACVVPDSLGWVPLILCVVKNERLRHSKPQVEWHLLHETIQEKPCSANAIKLHSL